MPCSPLSKKRTRQNGHALLLNQLQRKLPVIRHAAADIGKQIESALNLRTAQTAAGQRRRHYPDIVRDLLPQRLRILPQRRQRSILGKTAYAGNQRLMNGN